MVSLPLTFGIHDDVQAADFVNQAEEVAQIHVLQVDRNRLAGIFAGAEPALRMPVPLSGACRGRAAGASMRCRSAGIRAAYCRAACRSSWLSFRRIAD